MNNKPKKQPVYDEENKFEFRPTTKKISNFDKECETVVTKLKTEIPSSICNLIKKVCAIGNVSSEVDLENWRGRFFLRTYKKSLYLFLCLYKNSNFCSIHYAGEKRFIFACKCACVFCVSLIFTIFIAI